MANYNVYIGTLVTEKEAFSTELQKMKFFSEYLRAIAKMGSDFAWKVKKKGNWRIAGWGKDKINNLARPVHNYNIAHQDSKASQEVEIKTIGSKWRTEKAKFICQYNNSEKYSKKVRQACLHWSWE